jgi:hypothetical protein
MEILSGYPMRAPKLSDSSRCVVLPDVCTQTAIHQIPSEHVNVPGRGRMAGIGPTRPCQPADCHGRSRGVSYRHPRTCFIVDPCQVTEVSPPAQPSQVLRPIDWGRKAADRAAADPCKILFANLHEPCGKLRSLVMFDVPRPRKTDRIAECTNTTTSQFVLPLEALRSEREHQVLLARSIFWESQIDILVDRNSIEPILRYGWKRPLGGSQICLQLLHCQGLLKLETQRPPR